MRSAARFGPRRGGRLRPLLFLGTVLVLLAAGIAWSVLSTRSRGSLACRLELGAATDAWLLPQPPLHARRDELLLGGPGSPTTRVATGAPEDAAQYLRRMLAALGYAGEPVEVRAEGSCLTADERWIVRWTTFLTRPAAGELTERHLLAVRDRAEDVLSPYLLTSRSRLAEVAANGPRVIDVQPFTDDPYAHLGDVWSEIPNAFGAVTYGVTVRIAPDPSTTVQALLARHGANAWVQATPPSHNPHTGPPR